MDVTLTKGRPMQRPMDARPTVFILVEIKVRELRAKLHLAATAARAGFRSYVGTRSALNAAIASRPAGGGAYYFKGGEPLDELRRIRQASAYIVGQDEEIGPALSASDVGRGWQSRYSPAVSELIDRLYVYSEQHLDILARERPDLASKAIVTGWPRTDLWSAKFLADEQREAAAIRARHGRFVLFVSNFKVNSEAQKRQAIRAARALRDELPDDQRHVRLAEDDFGSKASLRLASFNRGVALLRELANGSDATLPRIIVRPHPAEDPGAWSKALADVEGVDVVYDGEVGPWLLATDAMLHTGCTIATQAAFYGVRCGLIAQLGFAPDDFTETASYVASEPLEDMGAIRAFIRDVAGGGTGTHRRALQGLPERLLGPSHGHAAERIVDDLVRLDIPAEAPLHSDPLVATRRVAAAAARRTRAITQPGPQFVGTNAQAKVPGGIHLREAKRIVTRLVDASAPGLSVAEPRFDLVEIVESRA